MTKTTKPEIESVAGYDKNRAPDAAKFGVGITDRAGAQEAQDARREHSRDLGSRPTSPSPAITSIP
jgi:hypothetical protein